MLDSYFEKEYWVVDILPEKVPEGSPGQYAAVEQYYLETSRIEELRGRYAEILIRLNAYYDEYYRVEHEFFPEEAGWIRNPEPEKLKERIVGMKKPERICALFRAVDTLVVLNGDDTYMTVYNPSKGFMEKLQKLALAEGLFVWQPEPAGAEGEMI